MNEISTLASLGRSINHDSSLRQTTGEAKYIDDITTPKNTLHLALVLSNNACGKITKIEKSAASRLKINPFRLNKTKIKLFNGKLESRLVKYEIYSGSKKKKNN